MFCFFTSVAVVFSILCSCLYRELYARF
uniref:Uncharacterized protein n=1 Tax=Arundo donax TaxID=35708 RepID=A0A0A9BKS6_ARUDO